MSGAKSGGNASALSGMQLQSSCYGTSVPILYGTNRIPGNLIDYDDFVATANKSGGGGFLGLGGSSITTGYTYGAMVVSGLCEGPIVTIGRCWEGQTVTTPALANGIYPLTVLTGARPQTTWSYLTTNHPGKALPYSGTALVCDWDWILPGGTMGNWSFETTGLLATESDSSSMILLGLGDGTKRTWNLLDANGLQIANMGPYPAWLTYVNATLTASTLGTASGYYTITFAVAPANGASVYFVGAPVVALDAKPASVISDSLTNPNYGAGVAAGWVADMVTGAGSYATYCTAMGFQIAPVFKDAKTYLEHLRDILDATNSELITTPNGSGTLQLQVIPYGDVAVGGYTPVTTIQAAFSDPDFLGVLDATGTPTGSDPIEITRQSPGDTFNTVPITFNDRMNAYNSSTVGIAEPTDAAINGTRKTGAKSLPCIVLRTHATILSTILGQGQVWRKVTFKFKVGWKAFLLEPMDFTSIASALMGLPTTRVRIVAITIPDEDSEDQGLTIEAEGWPNLGVAHAGAPLTSNGAGSGTTINTNIDPGPTIAPVIFDVPVLYSQSGGPEIMIGADGGPNWGGANVWISTDGTNYTQVGQITAPARYGTLTASMAASGGASVDLTLTTGAMASTTSTLALANQSLCWVAGASGGSGGELVDYSTATLTASFKYTLTLPVRGAYGTVAATHANGASFLVLDGAPFRFPVPLAWLGNVLYVKLQSFNVWGAGLESLASTSAVTYTPTSQGNYANPGGGTTQTIWNLNADDVLARAQKPNEINLVNQVLQVQGSPSTVGSLDYQAAQLGVGHSAYDTAVSALTTWLGALSPSWSDLTQDTPLGAGGGAYLRSLWSTIAAAQQALMAAIQAAALSSAATDALNKANVAILESQPHQVAWASTALPALPSGSYPAGYYALTSDHLTFQVNPAGTAWGQVFVGATGIFGQLVAGQLTVANFDNLVPNPNSDQTPPAGGWPSGAWEAVALETGDNPRTGNSCRRLSASQDLQITPWTPCSLGDQFFASVWDMVYLSGIAQFYMMFIDANGANPHFYTNTNTGTSYTNQALTASAIGGDCFVSLHIKNAAAVGVCYFDDFYFRRCADANMIVDGTLQALFARIAGAISSTNYSQGTTGTPSTGFKLSGTGMSITDVQGTPRSVLFDLGGGFLVQGNYADGLAFGKLSYSSSANGYAYSKGCPTLNGTDTWTWTAPQMGNSASNPYRVRVTIQGAGAGGSNGQGGGGGATAQIVLTVQAGTILSGNLGGPGGAGNNGGGNTTLTIGGTNISGFSSGLFATASVGLAVGSSGAVTGTLVLGGVGGQTSANYLPGPVSYVCSGAGGGGATTVGGIAAGFQAPGAQGGGSSVFGPGGQGGGLGGAGSAPATNAWGAGGGGGGTGQAQGRGGFVGIEIL